jgi:N-acetylmuramoyl-L-alanine amidase-like protein
MRSAHRRRARTLSSGLLLGALLVTLLPALPALAKGPIKVIGREVQTTVERVRTVRLPITASHVVLHWTGDHKAGISVAFGMTPTSLGEEVPVGHTEDADDAAGEAGAPAAAGGEEVWGDVLWTGGARFVRITSDRPLKHVTVVAIDAQADKIYADGGGAVASAATNQPPIIRRSAWGADESLRFDSAGKEIWPPSFYQMQKAIVHHTAGRNNDPNPAATVRAIYYLYAKSRDFGDMGYNFLIDEQGRIYEGRYSRPYPAGETPTGEDLAGNVVRGVHATDHNAGTVGIVLLGTFTNRMPTAAARNSLVNLLAWKLERHGIDPLGASTYHTILGKSEWLPNIAGHRQVSATACPGNTFFPTFPQLRQDVANRIAATTGPSHDTTPPSVRSLTPMVENPTGARTIPFGVIFREPITDFDASDLVVGGTSTGWSVADISGAASTYTVSLTAETPTDGTVDLTLAADAVTDLAGLTGPAADVTSSANYALDESAPSVVMYQTPHRVYITDPGFEYFNVTATFTEPVTDFTAADIAIGGTSHTARPWHVPAIYGSGSDYGFSVISDKAGWLNGTLTFQIPDGAVMDVAGNPTQGSNLISVVMDRSAPATSAPVARLMSGVTLNGSSLRIRLDWFGSDVGPAGIARYDLARSVDGGPFSIIGTPTSNVAVAWLSPWHDYRFEVRGRDKAGNVGAWKAGPTFRAKLIQQTKPKVVFSGSTRSAASAAYSGGSERQLLAAGSAARLTFVGRSVSFVSTRDTNRGSARIYIDGVFVTTIDLSGSPAHRFVAFTKAWGSAGTHTIRVVAVGTGRVGVDAFGVLR